MHTSRLSRVIPAVALLFASLTVAANDDPRHVRDQLMESVGDAAKPIGQMLREQADFDADVLRQSLEVFRDVAGEFGEHFPSGSESGEGTEAAPAIWEDREGFDQVLADWQAAIAEALAANPDSLDAAKPVVGPVFQQCKACHDTYRIEEE